MDFKYSPGGWTEFLENAVLGFICRLSGRMRGEYEENRDCSNDVIDGDCSIQHRCTGLCSAGTDGGECADAGTAAEGSIRIYVKGSSGAENSAGKLILELDNAEDIKAAISEGEKEFGVSLDESTRTTLASALQQLNGIGLNHETVIALAQKMYESYGDTLVENLSDALQEQLAGPLGETIQEQLIEPAKETVMETAKAIAANTAQHFWQDLKQSVIDFLNHVFQKGKN